MAILQSTPALQAIPTIPRHPCVCALPCMHVFTPEGLKVSNTDISPGSATPDRLIRFPEVKSLTGFKGTAHIYRLMARGDFPRAIKLGERAIAWRLSDIRAYLAARRPVQLNGASYARGYTPSAAQIGLGE